MNELRWILLGFGLLVMAAIYLWGRRSSAGREEGAELRVRARAEPALREAPAGVQADTHVFDASVQSGRIEPTLAGDLEPIEAPPPPSPPRPYAPVTAPVPTLSTSDAPQPRRVERRKILAVRLAATPHRIEGARLLEALHEDGLEHGKYEIFHRLHESGVSIFSVASMMEPGTFQPEAMEHTEYPGVTMFAQLPGPVPGMHALNELIASARKLQAVLGGTLQDDRGVPLTVHRIERMRQEVREFERPANAAARSATGHSTLPSRSTHPGV